MAYIFSAALTAILQCAVARLRAGHGACLLLEGPPGGGKTSFAKAAAEKLGGQFHYYSCAPDKERNLLYDISVQGVLERTRAWVKGPAWRAFEASVNGEFAVLLIDEVDKAAPGFDSFLLRLLEEWSFESPEGQEVKADPRKLVVIITSNGRRKLRQEVLRRCQRVSVPLPDNGRLQKIVRQIAGRAIAQRALDLVVRIGDKVRGKDLEAAPSPKELALCLVDLHTLREQGVEDLAVWREVAAGWLTKTGGPEFIDRATGYKWAKALKEEVK